MKKRGCAAGLALLLLLLCGCGARGERPVMENPSYVEHGIEGPLEQVLTDGGVVELIAGDKVLFSRTVAADSSGDEPETIHQYGAYDMTAERGTIFFECDVLRHWAFGMSVHGDDVYLFLTPEGQVYPSLHRFRLSNWRLERVGDAAPEAIRLVHAGEWMLLLEDLAEVDRESPLCYTLSRINPYTLERTMFYTQKNGDGIKAGPEEMTAFSYYDELVYMTFMDPTLEDLRSYMETRAMDGTLLNTRRLDLLLKRFGMTEIISFDVRGDYVFMVLDVPDASSVSLLCRNDDQLNVLAVWDDSIWPYGMPGQMYTYYPLVSDESGAMTFLDIDEGALLTVTPTMEGYVAEGYHYFDASCNLAIGWREAGTSEQETAARGVVRIVNLQDALDAAPRVALNAGAPLDFTGERVLSK